MDTLLDEKKTKFGLYKSIWPLSYFGEMFVSELLVLYIIIISVVMLHGYPQRMRLLYFQWHVS